MHCYCVGEEKNNCPKQILTNEMALGKFFIWVQERQLWDCFVSNWRWFTEPECISIVNFLWPKQQDTASVTNYKQPQKYLTNLNKVQSHRDRMSRNAGKIFYGWIYVWDGTGTALLLRFVTWISSTIWFMQILT